MKKNLAFGGLAVLILVWTCTRQPENTSMHDFNESYSGDNLNRIAFPLGGMGAGMICLEGNGSFSQVSVRHTPDVFKTSFMFAALSLKGRENGARILEGPPQDWKIYGSPGTANGNGIFGCPRYGQASFLARFPFGTVSLTDQEMPVEVTITGWSPFIPGDPDNSGLPAGALEYTLHNTSGDALEATFSFHAENFMRVELPGEWGGNFVGRDSILSMDQGFVLKQPCFPDKPHYKGEFAVFTDETDAVVDHCWFRGGWFDAKTMLWKNISENRLPANPVSGGATGASVYVPVRLKPHESRTIRMYLAWYVPHSDISAGNPPLSEPAKPATKAVCAPGNSCCSPELTSRFYEPYYSARFSGIAAVSTYWRKNYTDLRAKSALFSKAWFGSDLPPEVLEAISANLSILKSPTVMRQKDGRLWLWEGCHDQAGCCNGSCTHVYNYAMAMASLFPSLERSLRETEFLVDQDSGGHQNFRANLPISTPGHGFYAAADGQLGGIVKVYRDWRISGDDAWLKRLFPAVKKSMDYSILQWDPRHTGTIEEPHHNTYDIEFWGPEPLCTGFYAAALNAFVRMSDAMGEPAEMYAALLEKSRKAMEDSLFNGSYFRQQVKWKGLTAADPTRQSLISIGTNYSPEALEVLQKEGPKYQYGNGCLSDGVLGLWVSRMCGLGNVIDSTKINSHLESVYRYNYKPNLTYHVNPQRASYAYGKEGGLILCSWPGGDQPSLPFVYSNEVWTGIEYQVASHLIMTGHLKEGLTLVKACRSRYDGRIRNPFDEYECGHWYGRALASYGLIQALTGLSYDAVSKCLYIDSKIGTTFSCFIATETGFGMAGLKKGKPFIQVLHGFIDVKTVRVSGRTMSPEIVKSDALSVP